MPKCKKCEFNHGILVRDVPWLGTLCYSCFNKRLDELDDILWKWENEVLDDLKSRIKFRLERGESPASVYKVYPFYLTEDVFVQLMGDTKISKVIRDKLLFFLYSEEHYKLQRMDISSDHLDAFSREIDGLGLLRMDKMKKMIDRLSDFRLGWELWIDNFFMREVSISYEDPNALNGLMQIYRDYLYELKDATLSLLCRMDGDRDTKIYKNLDKFYDRLLEELLE